MQRFKSERNFTASEVIRDMAIKNNHFFGNRTVAACIVGKYD
jgi:hypothetical protein